MAIQLATVDSAGHSSDYWRLVSITIDRATLTAKGYYYLYKSQADYLAGNAHLRSVTTQTTVTSTSAINVIVSALNAAIKAGPLTGGTDILDD